MTLYRKKVQLINTQKPEPLFQERFQNEIYHSKISTFEQSNIISNFSIKYVVSGEEGYYLDNKKFTVLANDYLVVNNGQEFCITDVNAEGVCIYLSSDVIGDTFRNYIFSQDKLLDSPFFFKENTGSVNFFEKVYSGNDSLGDTLKEIHAQISQFPNKPISQEFYFLMAESLIKSQIKVRMEIEKITSLKKTTREEIYRRISEAKDYIMQNYHQKFSIDKLSLHVALSKFQLIRRYKEVFGITPYNHYLQTKINRSKNELLDSELSIAEIASDYGFNDVYSYSKYFRKTFGKPPATYRRANGKV